ncbi:unnamed protein product [Clonostachys solani]|uniref:HNH nuclease domain-containing protein n=1 Tax=Clonostachys solani TaxID=160281 RepID=A0A9N9ZH99_9HYPO|nr:unnamed protein product [Clonostachys solani]
MENSTMKDLMAGPGIRQVTQLLPADEMETRLEYIQKIEKGQRAFRKNPSWGFTPYQYATLALVFLSSGLGATDKTWNMICLSPQLQTWWSHGYFGLKYLGHEDDKETGMSMAELQFVWMPHSHYDESTKRIDLNEEKDKARNIRVCVEHMFGGEPPCSPQCGRCTAISKVQAHEVRERYTIESGYVFPVVRRTEDIQKFKAMIQLQWAAFCVGSMSGAANHPKLLERV